MKMKWKITLPMLVILLLSMLITTLTGYFSTKNTVDQMVDNVLDGSLDMIIDEIARAKRTENIILEEINEKNLALAHLFAEKIQIKSQEGSLDLNDVQFFIDMTEMLGIIEINLVDNAGTIVGSNFADYYGWNYGEAEATKKYLQIIADPTHEIIEEPREDAISGNVTMYLGIARKDSSGFIQLGFEAESVKTFRNNLDISHVAAGLRVGLTGRASILRDGVVVYSQKSEITGNDVSSEQWYAQVSSGRGKTWIDMNGEKMYAGYAEIDGYVFLVLFPREEYNSYLSSVIWIGIIGVAVLLSAAVLLLRIAGNISKPIVALSAFMSKAASTGDIVASREEEEILVQYTKSRDETGQLLKSSGAFVDHVVNISNVLETIANGDLSNDVNLLSGSDTIGKSLNHMINKLNSMFSEINNSTHQVSAGATQISDGAQALAQGSTQQAASVEELSASITSIADKTRENAKMASKAAKLAQDIKNSAEKGSRQMDEMVAAVRDISTASQSIGKVIKVIDDIAFQTNILALNAAVEAARAGQHGKGFAVVAEEVRNLASKSADAAKETGVLIQNSMEKAGLGETIAGETAVSLAQIVYGINESSQIVGEISRSSEEQTQGIEQINSGIDQVAQVVQQNSATAEESAAASEQMSGQSAALEGLVAQFKLKRSVTSGRSAPANASADIVSVYGKY